MERELTIRLYRFDCPSPHQLGEYNLDLVGPEDRTRIAAHVVDCGECRAELTLLREFLAQPTPVTSSEPLFRQARRIIATLLPPKAAGLAYGGLRGNSDTTARTFAAG